MANRIHRNPGMEINAKAEEIHTLREELESEKERGYKDRTKLAECARVIGQLRENKEVLENKINEKVDTLIEKEKEIAVLNSRINELVEDNEALKQENATLKLNNE